VYLQWGDIGSASQIFEVAWTIDGGDQNVEEWWNSNGNLPNIMIPKERLDRINMVNALLDGSRLVFAISNFPSPDIGFEFYISGVADAYSEISGACSST
jgi:hypothetical protein